MRTDALQQESREVMNTSRLRQRLTREVSGGYPSQHSRQLHPSTVAGEELALANGRPLRELNQTNFARRLDSCFDGHWLTGLGNGGKTQAQPELNPACDFFESPHEYLVTAHLPDVRHDQVIVVLDGGVLTLCAERSHETVEEDKKKHFQRIKSQQSSFLLNFTLPENVAGDAASTEFKDDLLLVHLPKCETSRFPRRDLEAR